MTGEVGISPDDLGRLAKRAQKGSAHSFAITEARLPRELAKDHTVVVPDLRGMGLSSHPAGGYDKWTQAGDIRAVLDKLGIDRADIVAHDIGAMVAYAYAVRYPDKTTRLVIMDSPIPGIPSRRQTSIELSHN